MAQKGRIAIALDASQQYIIDNNKKEITAAMMREFMQIVNDSKFNLTDDTLANIKLSNTNLGDNAENALENSININSYGSPLFYVKVNWYNTTTSSTSQSEVNLSSFSSNNSTVSITQSRVEKKDNIFTITYSNTYGSSSQLVRKYESEPTTFGRTINSVGIPFTTLAADTYPDTIVETGTPLEANSSVSFYSVYADNRPTATPYGGSGVGSFFLVFYNNDFTYMADL